MRPSGSFGPRLNPLSGDRPWAIWANVGLIGPNGPHKVVPITPLMDRRPKCPLLG